MCSPSSRLNMSAASALSRARPHLTASSSARRRYRSESRSAASGAVLYSGEMDGPLPFHEDVATRVHHLIPFTWLARGSAPMLVGTPRFTGPKAAGHTYFTPCNKNSSSAGRTGCQPSRPCETASPHSTARLTLACVSDALHGQRCAQLSVSPAPWRMCGDLEQNNQILRLEFHSPGFEFVIRE
jgi:hypothetical protein